MPRSHSLFSRSASGVLKGENEVGGEGDGDGDEDAPLSVFCSLVQPGMLRTRLAMVLQIASPLLIFLPHDWT